MTVTRSRSDPMDITALRLEVRDLVGDIVASSAGTDAAPAFGNQRYSDVQIDRRIVQEMRKMYAAWSQEQGGFWSSSDLTYTADADTVALGAAYASAPIGKVARIEGSNILAMRRMDPFEIDRYTDFNSGGSPFPNYVWTLIDSSIAVRPKPSAALTLRIWYVGNPFTDPGIDSYGDQTPTASVEHPYPVVFEELITLGAARRLLGRDDIVPQYYHEQYMELWDQFLNLADRYRGPVYPRSTRRIRS